MRLSNVKKIMTFKQFGGGLSVIKWLWGLLSLSAGV